MNTSCGVYCTKKLTNSPDNYDATLHLATIGSSIEKVLKLSRLWPRPWPRPRLIETKTLVSTTNRQA